MQLRLRYPSKMLAADRLGLVSGKVEQTCEISVCRSLRYLHVPCFLLPRPQLKQHCVHLLPDSSHPLIGTTVNEIINVFTSPDFNVCLFSILHQAGSQLEALSDEQMGGVLLDACLHTLAVVYTSLQSKNPLRRAIAR